MPTLNRYYYIIDNKQMGPNTAEDMGEAIQAGVFTEATLVCLEGGSQWNPLSRYPELSAYLPAESKLRRTGRVKVKAVPAPQKTTEPRTALVSEPAASKISMSQLKTTLKRCFPGFNVNSVLLLVLIVLVSIQIWGGEPKYRYDAINITREEVAFDKKWQDDMAKRSVEFKPRYIPSGWEYVGPLCNDGVNGAWILIRRPQ